MFVTSNALKNSAYICKNFSKLNTPLEAPLQGVYLFINELTVQYGTYGAKLRYGKPVDECETEDFDQTW